MMNDEGEKKILQEYQRRLNLLKEKMAREGYSADPKILMEIEDIELEMNRMGGAVLGNTRKSKMGILKYNGVFIVIGIMFVAFLVYNLSRLIGLEGDRLNLSDGVSNSVNVSGDNPLIAQAGGDVIVQVQSPVADVGLEQAIRVDYQENYSTFAVVDGFDPDKNIEYYENNRKSQVPLYLSVKIDVVGRSDDEWVKIAPFLAVKMIDIRPISETTNILFPAGGGSADIYDVFSATFSTEQDKIFGAPYVVNTMLSPENKKPEYFTLEKGEIESFNAVFVLSEGGYYYYFKIGVVYSYKGQQSVKWIDETFVMGTPLHCQSWNYNTLDGSLEKEESCFYPYTKEELRESIAEEKNTVENDIGFSLPNDAR